MSFDEITYSPFVFVQSPRQEAWNALEKRGKKKKKKKKEHSYCVSALYLILYIVTYSQYSTVK